jgi:hypothetical protein
MLGDVHGDRWDVEDLPPVTDTCWAPSNSEPQRRQPEGSWATTTSGSTRWRSVVPSWPGCPPGLRPDERRSDFGGGLARPSDDGGFEEFREFAFSCASNSATRAFNRAFSSESSITLFCRSPTRLINSAIVGSGMNLFSQHREYPKRTTR